MRFLFFCLLLASCSSAEKQVIGTHSTTPKLIQIEVQGHRGARGRYPENSIPAFKHALEVGVDVLEFDLGVSKDNELIIAHDPFINEEQCLDSKKKKIKEKIPLRMLTLSQIKAYRCGTLTHPRFPKQKKLEVTYATLREVFELVRNSKLGVAQTVRFNIETKIIPAYSEYFPSPFQFAQLVVNLAKEYDFIDRIVLQSFDHRTLSEVKKIEPRIKISPLVENTLLNLTAMAKDLNAEIVSPNHLWITPEDIQTLHQANIQVIPWTANEEKDWERLIALKVDGIITDYPEELISYLKKKGLR